MLQAGKWLFTVLILSFSTLGLGAEGKQNLKNPILSEKQVREEQQAAFGISGSVRLLPQESWFVKSAYYEDNHLDPVAQRWIDIPSVEKRKNRNR